MVLLNLFPMFHLPSLAVFGWLSESFTGVEREARHTLEVGVTKGAGQDDLSFGFRVLPLYSSDGMCQ